MAELPTYILAVPLVTALVCGPTMLIAYLFFGRPARQEERTLPTDEESKADPNNVTDLHITLRGIPESAMWREACLATLTELLSEERAEPGERDVFSRCVKDAAYTADRVVLEFRKRVNR